MYVCIMAKVVKVVADRENNHTGTKSIADKLTSWSVFCWKFQGVFVFFSLLPDFPYKSFMSTAILRMRYVHRTTLIDWDKHPLLSLGFLRYDTPSFPKL